MPVGTVIRFATAADAPAVCAIYRPIVESTIVSFETEAPDDSEMRRRIVETQHTYPWLVFERDGRVLGYAYATRHRTRHAYRWSVDTSVYVAEGARGQRLGVALYASLFAVLEAQGFVRAYAGIALPNPASVGLHERMGFVAIGVYHAVGYKLGAWRDVGWWEKAIVEASSPREPVPLPSLVMKEQWLARGLGELSRR